MAVIRKYKDPIITRLIYGLALWVAVSGCAFMDAASFGPNFSLIQIGTPRPIVEQELGRPITRILGTPGMSVDVYEYRVNTHPSRLRAFANLLKSVFTLGLWEFWSRERLTPYRIKVVYDKAQRVSEMRQVDVVIDQDYENLR